VLDTIAGNLSNIDTPGFRAMRPEFAALLEPGGKAIGVAQQQPRMLFTQGRLDDTNNEFDLAIDGDGFFRVRDSHGRVAYTRAGNFTPDASGRLCLPNGAALEGVRLPAYSTGVTVSRDGRVQANVAGRKTAAAAGRVGLFGFANTDALVLGSDGLFYATPPCGALYQGKPGSGGLGAVKQRCLERANVGVVDAMMSLLAAQRAYEANAKAVQAADEMLRLANNLERG
jgi:flagellar basal-body rod protein FlgG